MREVGNWLVVRSVLLSAFLGLKQIRRGIPEVLGPLHAGSVKVSERITSMIEIYFNQKKIHNSSELVHNFFQLISLYPRLTSFFLI